MRVKLLIAAFAVSLVLTFQSHAQTTAPIFPKGDLFSANNHTGNIWFNELSVRDSTFDPSVAVATYDAGAMLDWHVYPGGQVLLITEGFGFIRKEGSQSKLFTKET
jgi:hypothetical protein